MDETVVISDSDEENDVEDETKRDCPEECEGGETVVISESDEEDEAKGDSPEECESGKTVVISESDEETDVEDETKRDFFYEYECGETVIINDSDDDSVRATSYTTNKQIMQSGDQNTTGILDYAIDKWSRTAVHGAVCGSETLEAVENRRGLREKQVTPNEEISPPPGNVQCIASAQLLAFGDRISKWKSTGEFQQLLKQLVEVYPMPDRLAIIWLEMFLDELLEYVFLMPSSITLSEFRNKVAFLAKESGRERFTLSDKWFIEMKNPTPRKVVGHKGISHNPQLRQFSHSVNSSSSGIDTRKLLAEWYKNQSSKSFVSPGQLERAVVVIMHYTGIKGIFPSKPLLQTFVGEHGLFNYFNGKRLLFKNAETGLLKHLFEAVFEVWYHEWPTSIDELLTSESNKNPYYKNYLVALTEWYAKSCATHAPYDISPKAIKHKEIMYAKRILGLGVGEYKILRKLSHNVLHVAEVDIRSFSTEISYWYCSRNYPVLCKHLLDEAVRLAELIGVSHFTPTRDWAQRFAQLTAVHSLATHSNLRPMNPHNSFPWDSNDFDCSFQKWFDGQKWWTLPEDNVNAKSTTKLNNVQGLEILNSDDIGTVLRQNVGTGSELKHGLVDEGCQTKLDVELGKWYSEQIKTRLVQRNELQVKAKEIAGRQRLYSFNPTRDWMRSFIMRNGLNFIDECDGKLKRAKISPYTYDVGKFLKIFDSWYAKITIHIRSEKRSHFSQNEKNPNILSIKKDQGEKRQHTFPNPPVKKRSKLPSLVSVGNQDVRNPNHSEKLPSLGNQNEKSPECSEKIPSSDSVGSQNEKSTNLLSVKKDQGEKRPQTNNNVPPQKKTLLRTWYDLDAAVHKWYVEQPSSCLVAPGDLEKKTKEIAEHLPVNVSNLSRHWTENFINRHGLYININGNCERFLKPTFEFLKYKFEGEFEVWYHQWPLTLEESLLNDDSVRFKPYEEALLNWYLEESKTNMISECDIKNMSSAIIKSEIPEIKLEDADELSKLWGQKYSGAMLMIRTFDSALSTWYRVHLDKYSIKPDALRLKAATAAIEMGFSKFRITQTWLKRFTERHGFEFEEGSFEFPSSDVVDVDELFEVHIEKQESCDVLDETHSTKQETFDVPEEKHFVEKESFDVPDEKHTMRQESFDVPDEKHTTKQRTFDVPDGKHSVKEGSFDVSDEKHTVKQETFDVPDEKHSIKQESFDVPDEKHTVKQETFDVPDEKHPIKQGSFHVLDKRHTMKQERFSLTTPDSNSDGMENHCICSATAPKFSSGFNSVSSDVKIIIPPEVGLLNEMAGSVNRETEHYYSDLGFETEMSAWYREESSKGVIAPGWYLIKALELCNLQKTTNYRGLAFGHSRKQCMLKLVEIHGLYLNANGVTTLFSIAQYGISKARFHLLFEVWFHAYPLKLDGVIVDEYKKCFTSRRSIGNLDAAVWAWYREHTYCVKPEDLREKARHSAIRLNIEGFSVTPAWLKRFVQLHGLYFMYKGQRKDFPGFGSDATDISLHSFDILYDQWRSSDRVETRGHSSIHPSHLLYSDHPSTDVVSRFDEAVRTWYADRSSNRPVRSGELKLKAQEIAWSMGMADFVATELWLKEFVEKEGLWAIVNDRLMLLKLDPSASESRNGFQAVFLPWLSEISGVL